MMTRTPGRIVAGDSVEWTLSVSHNGEALDPADGWVLTYELRQHKAAQSFTATDNGDGTFLITLTAADTADWGDGVYLYQAHATNGATRHTVEKGSIEVSPNFAALGAFDTRPWAVRTLAAVEATLEGVATHDQLGYSIEGRSLSRMTRAELMDWRQRLEVEVYALRTREQMAKGLASPHQIRVRF